jgi:hypothetical protein
VYDGPGRKVRGGAGALVRFVYLVGGLVFGVLVVVCGVGLFQVLAVIAARGGGFVAVSNQNELEALSADATISASGRSRPR